MVFIYILFILCFECLYRQQRREWQNKGIKEVNICIYFPFKFLQSLDISFINMNYLTLLKQTNIFSVMFLFGWLFKKKKRKSLLQWD